MDKDFIQLVTEAVMTLFNSSKLARCTTQESNSGHSFAIYPPFSSMNLEGVKIVRVCTYCGKVLEDEVKGLAKISANVNNSNRAEEYAN